MPDPKSRLAEKIELEVRRAISSEVETYRATMESYSSRVENFIKLIAGAASTVAAIVVGIAFYFFGQNFKETKQNLAELVGQKVSDLAIAEEMKVQLRSILTNHTAQLERQAVTTASNNISSFGALLETQTKRTISNEISAVQVRLIAEAGGAMATNISQSARLLLERDFNERINRAMADGVKALESLNETQRLQLTASVPAGTVVAYAGTTVDPKSGWLQCDGRAVSRTEFANLFRAIGISWGGGDGINTFTVPDLRGLFLRGVDQAGKSDPDFATRTNWQGQAGPAVGSFQTDGFREHSHNLAPNWVHGYGPEPGGGTKGHLFDLPGGQRGIPTSGVGGSETRPKNAYVYYLIKY